MKYVIMKVEHKGMYYEYPVIFANQFVHADMADAAKDQLQTIYKDARIRCVSAGEVSSMDVGAQLEPTGHSASLDVCSRGTHDAAIILPHDYSMGIVAG